MANRNEIQASFDKIPGMNCFVCAPERLNPMGLNLVFEETEDGARTTFQPESAFQSYPGFLHGGILCAILDETMAYAGIFKRRVLPFTKWLEVQYRLGVESSVPHVCEAELTRNRIDSFEAVARIEDERGRAIVMASAEFVIPSWKMAKKMMPQVALDEFRHFFIDREEVPEMEQEEVPEKDLLPDTEE